MIHKKNNNQGVFLELLVAAKKKFKSTENGKNRNFPATNFLNQTEGKKKREFVPLSLDL